VPRVSEYPQSHVGARGKRRGFSPGAAAHHSQSARVLGRPAAEGFLSPMSPRAHWIGPELCGSCPEGSVMSMTAEFISFFFHYINSQYARVYTEFPHKHPFSFFRFHPIPILSYPILSYPIPILSSSYPILSYPILSNPILS